MVLFYRTGDWCRYITLVPTAIMKSLKCSLRFHYYQFFYLVFITNIVIFGIITLISLFFLLLLSYRTYTTTRTPRHHTYSTSPTHHQHKANVNIWDLWKYTPLHEASAKGKFDICKLLLKVRALLLLLLYF